MPDTGPWWGSVPPLQSRDAAVEAGTPAMFPGDSPWALPPHGGPPGPLGPPSPQFVCRWSGSGQRVCFLQSCLVYLLAHGGQLVSGSFAPGPAGWQMGGGCLSRPLTLGPRNWVATNHLFPVYSSHLCVHVWPAVFSDSNMRATCSSLPGQCSCSWLCWAPGGTSGVL